MGPKAPGSALRFPAVLDRGVGSSVLTFLKEAGRNVPYQTKSEPLPSHFPSSEERCRNAHAAGHCSFVASGRSNLVSRKSFELNTRLFVPHGSEGTASRIETPSRGMVPKMEPLRLLHCLFLRVAWRVLVRTAARSSQKSISGAIRPVRTGGRQCRHEQTAKRLATEIRARRHAAIRAAHGVVRWDIPRALLGEPKDLLLRLRYEGRHPHVHADVRAAEICQPVVGRFLREEETRSQPGPGSPVGKPPLEKDESGAERPPVVIDPGC